MTAEEFYYNWVVEGNNIDKGIIEVAEAYHKYKLKKNRFDEDRLVWFLRQFNIYAMKHGYPSEEFEKELKEYFKPNLTVE